MLHSQLAALALAATTLAASGCGGSPKAGSTAAPISTTATTATVKVASGNPLTRAELIAAAGAICKRIDARHASLNLATQQAIAREIPVFAAYQKAALAELSKLTPPPSMAHDWKQFAAAAHTLARDMARFGEYAKANPPIATYARILPTIDKDERHVSALAKRDTINECEQVY